MSRPEILIEREKTHGSFQKVAFTAQQLKIIMRSGNQKHAMQMEALDMIASKIARIMHGNPWDKDHWVDIAGYAKLGEEACPFEEKP